MEENENSLELIETRDALELVPAWEFQTWWIFAGLAAVVLLALLLIPLFRRKKTTAEDPAREKREAYKEAKAAFAKGGAEGGGFRETAAWSSLVLRRYLARSMSEPALFETHEEFIGRHDGLKDLPGDLRVEVGDFFTLLANLKYAPQEGSPLSPGEIEAGGAELLERIHRA